MDPVATVEEQVWAMTRAEFQMSHRDQLVLDALLDGETHKEVALRLDLTRSSVGQSINRMREKNVAATTAELAYAVGLFQGKAVENVVRSLRVSSPGPQGDAR